MSKAKVAIRKATVDDIDALVELNRQIGELHFRNAPTVFAKPSAEEKQFLLDALANLERLFIVAVTNGVVSGFLTASISKNEVVPFITKDPICQVNTIVVDQQHQALGLGKLLMLECQVWASSLGASEIRLEVMAFNHQAQGFYENLGFHTQSKIMSKLVTN